MASQLSSFRDELRYVIGRRGFLEAETLYQQSGDSSELISRMHDNLIAGNPLIRNMLAVHENKIAVTSTGDDSYYFPDGMAGAL